MRRKRLIAAVLTFMLSAMPLSELYAACTYTPTAGGGEIRHCSNGTCSSTSLWKDNQLVSVLDVTCV